MGTIESYIEQQDKIISEYREKTLISLGLCEKEYAPDNTYSAKYPQYDYKNGEKSYYRDVAIKVTDEQWAEIIEKAQAVQKIKEQEEREAEQNRRQPTYQIIKKWIPVFEFPKPTYPLEEENSKQNEGKSNFARTLKIIAILLGIACIVAGCIFMGITGGIEWIFIGVISAVVTALPFIALGEILDYLAELSAIARNGYKYKEARDQRKK